MSDETISGRTAVNLTGRISATSRTRARGTFQIALASNIFAAARVRGSSGVSYLFGRITASSHLISQATLAHTTAVLTGRILATSIAGIPSFLFRLPLLASRITATSTLLARGMRPWLTGGIQAQGTAQLRPALFPTGRYLGLTGSVTAAATAQIQLPNVYPLFATLGGAISARSIAHLDHGYFYNTKLYGLVSSTARLYGRAQPRQNILRGKITGAARSFFAHAEVQTARPPYPPPFPTFTTLDYLNKITSEHNQRPRYMATVGMNIDPIVSDQQLVAGMAGLFDLDYCVGQQEDFTGQWIGKSRWIELPQVFFYWDELGLGWNEGNWKGPADADDSLQRLDDYHYRLLLYANIIANHWDGSIPAAYDAWDTLFQYTGIKVLIQDYGNMTMLYGILSTDELDAVLVSLFLSGQMDLRPEGVELLAYALQPEPNVPYFAWDAESDSVHGWDKGYWGLMRPPGLPSPFEGKD